MKKIILVIAVLVLGMSLQARAQATLGIRMPAHVEELQFDFPLPKISVEIGDQIIFLATLNESMRSEVDLAIGFSVVHTEDLSISGALGARFSFEEEYKEHEGTSFRGTLASLSVHGHVGQTHIHVENRFSREYITSLGHITRSEKGNFFLGAGFDVVHFIDKNVFEAEEHEEGLEGIEDHEIHNENHSEYVLGPVVGLHHEFEKSELEVELHTGVDLGELLAENAVVPHIELSVRFSLGHTEEEHEHEHDNEDHDHFQHRDSTLFSEQINNINNNNNLKIIIHDKYATPVFSAPWVDRYLWNTYTVRESDHLESDTASSEQRTIVEEENDTEEGFFVPGERPEVSVVEGISPNKKWIWWEKLVLGVAVMAVPQLLIFLFLIGRKKR